MTATDPLCACGHRKSKHGRGNVGDAINWKGCGARLVTENRKPGQRYAKWCGCKWFRLALTEEVGDE